MSDPRLIVALDFDTSEKALRLAEALEPSRCRLKIGKELFTRAGPELVRRLQDDGFQIFLDLKFHDIPNTVVGACRSAAELGVWMFNVHALGGRAMMRAARAALETYEKRPLLVAVTLLTSIGEAELRDMGLEGSPSEQVCRLARLAEQSGLDGVVCSALELAALRESCREGFLFVTPGIRPAGADLHDQKRTLGPREALEAGASYLVVGRAVTQAAEPLRALEAIEAEVGSAGSERVSRVP